MIVPRFLLPILISGVLFLKVNHAQLSVAEYALAATTAGTRVFFGGGENGASSYSNVVDIFESSNNTWSTATLSAGRYRLAAATVGNASVGTLKVLFGGGYNGTTPYSNVVDIYASSNNTWSTSTLSAGRSSLAAASVGTKVLFGGGTDGTVFSNVVDIYESSNNTWSIAYLSIGRYRLTAATVGTKVLFGGGYDGSSYSTVVDIYESSNQTWTTARLTAGRSSLVAATVGTKVLFGGGTDGSSYSNVVDIYESSNNTWSTATLSNGRFGLAAASVGTKVLFGGGQNGTSAFSNVVDIYESSNNTWSTATLSAARIRLVAATVGTKVLFGGGYDGISYFNVVDVYDSICNMWSTAPQYVVNCSLSPVGPAPTPSSAPPQGTTSQPTSPTGILFTSSPGTSSPSGPVPQGATPQPTSPILFTLASGTSSPSRLVSSLSPLSAPVLFVSSPSVTPSVSPSAHRTSASSVPTGLSLPVILGIVGGVLVLLVVVLVLVYIFFIRKRQSRVSKLAMSDTLDLDNPFQSFEAFFLLVIPERTRNSVTLSRDKEVPSGSPEYRRILSLFRALDGEQLIPAIISVTAVINARIRTNFTNQRDLLLNRHQEDPALFKKTDWTRAREADLRSWTVHEYNKYAQRFSWNNINDLVPVVPVLHGTDVKIAHKIVKNGFSALSSLDSGYFGRGIYFSSSALYTLPYYAAKGRPALLLCLAIPGNIYPVVESPKDQDSLLGTPIKSGYQSNYALTTKDGLPCKNRTGSFYDELVLDQESQVVPFAIIEFDKTKVSTMAQSFQRVVPEFYL